MFGNNYVNKLFLFVLILLGCKNQAERYIYLDSGELKLKYFYPNKNDTSSYIFYGYYKDGSIKEIRNIRKSKREGHYIKFFKNGNIRELISYSKDKINGPYLKYNEEGILETEFLGIQGVPKIIKSYQYHPGFYGIVIYKGISSKDSAVVFDGLLHFRNDNIVPDSSSYYFAFAKDTIANIEYKFDVEIFNNNEPGNYSSMLLLGDLDKDLNFKNPNEVDTISNVGKTIRVKYIPEHEGPDLLLGKLFLINKDNEAVIKDYLFYHEFFVLKDKHEKGLFK